MKLPSAFVKNTNIINAVIETPLGSAAKYNFDEETGSFKLKKILPQGLIFPFHFGFIPNTLAEDRDPLDVLVLMKEPSWPGCVIECKVLGIIEATQKQYNGKVSNDRIVAAPVASPYYDEIEDIFSFESGFLNDILQFFISYTKHEKKDFTITGTSGTLKALDIIKKLIINANNT